MTICITVAILFPGQCFKVVISKGLGYGIILGSVLGELAYMKLVQTSNVIDDSLMYYL